MSNYFNALDSILISNKPRLREACPGTQITLDSKATLILDNFSVSKPVILLSDLGYGHIRDVLVDIHTDYALIESSQNEILGVLSTRDILGVHAMAVANEYQRPLKELSAIELMRPINKISALTLADVERAKIGDIISTFEHQAMPYLLVVDQGELIGLFTLNKIKQALGTKREVTTHATSMTDIVQAINGHQ